MWLSNPGFLLPGVPTHPVAPLPEHTTQPQFNVGASMPNMFIAPAPMPAVGVGAPMFPSIRLDSADSVVDQNLESAKRKSVVSAAPTITSSATLVGAKRSSTEALETDDRPSKKMVSLLAAYDDDDSGSEELEKDKKDEPEEKPAAQKQSSAVALASHWWEHWQDMINPSLRHGLEMGRNPAELVAAWPRTIQAYPPGHPPCDPPGCCSSSCFCMDGLRVQDLELRKPWIEDAPGAVGRAKAAREVVEAFARQSFVVERGRQSRQHLLQPHENNIKEREIANIGGVGGDNKKNIRKAFDELRLQAATAMREALDNVSVESLQGRGFRLPLGALLPADKPYEPVRLETDDTSPSGAIRVTLAQVQLANDKVLPQVGSVQNVCMLLFEGKLVVPACRISSEAFSPKSLQTLTSGLVEKIASLPSCYRMPFLESLAGVWDCNRHTCLEGTTLASWLEAVDRIFLLSRASAVAHVLPPFIAEVVLPSPLPIPPLLGLPTGLPPQFMAPPATSVSICQPGPGCPSIGSLPFPTVPPLPDFQLTWSGLSCPEPCSAQSIEASPLPIPDSLADPWGPLSLVPPAPLASPTPAPMAGQPLPLKAPPWKRPSSAMEAGFGPGLEAPSDPRLVQAPLAAGVPLANHGATAKMGGPSPSWMLDMPPKMVAAPKVRAPDLLVPQQPEWNIKAPPRTIPDESAGSMVKHAASGGLPTSKWILPKSAGPSTQIDTSHEN